MQNTYGGENGKNFFMPYTLSSTFGIGPNTNMKNRKRDENFFSLLTKQKWSLDNFFLNHGKIFGKDKNLKIIILS
jgi:hypothetical protein